MTVLRPLPRERARDASGQCLLALLCLVPLIIHAGGLGFAPLVVLMGGAGWIVWLLLAREHLRGVRLFVPLILFFLWMALTSFWGQYGPGTALRLGLQAALTASIPVLILAQTGRMRVTMAHLLMATALAGTAILALDVASGFGLNLLIDPVGAGEDLNKRQGDAEMNTGQGQLVYAIFTPLLIGLFGSRLPRELAIIGTVLFLAALLGGSVFNRLMVPFFIFGAAFPLMWLGYYYPQLGRRAALSLAVGSILFAPIVGIVSRLMPETVLARLPLSWDHRLRMWDYALARIQEHPFIGHGLDSSRTMQDSFTTRIGVDVPYISLHPHNIGLQTWLELGGIGAILLSAAIISLSGPLVRYADGSPWRSSALSGAIGAITVAGLITVGAWQYWWWGAAALAIMLIPLIPARRRTLKLKTDLTDAKAS